MKIDPTKQGADLALTALARDQIGWLTTVNPDGQPQSSPIWFLWEDDEVRFYSHKTAPRNGNIADRPKVSFNLNTDLGGDEVVTVEGTARVDVEAPSATGDAAYLAKYKGRIDGYGWTVEEFATNYPHLVRITPTRWRF